ncbi:unnamed protein product [Durusdinium trenchii]
MPRRFLMNHLKQNASQAGNFDVCGWALWASARRQRSSETGQSWDDWASISIFANNDAIECQLSPVATISLCCLLPKPVACDSRRFSCLDLRAIMTLLAT